jgi:hypothetical protein
MNPLSPRLPARHRKRQWLTTPVTFAAANTNKELKFWGAFARTRGGSSILMVNGGLMAKPDGTGV